MIAILFSCLSVIGIITGTETGEKDRIIVYYDTEFKTTYEVPEMFYGVYEGRKAGYLKLNPDGTGEYKYDIFGLAPASCERKPIQFNWGFILDEQGKLVKNKRDYGFSYPVLFESTGSNSFQGCRKVVLKDFILQRGDILHVSSSDDWQKATN